MTGEMGALLPCGCVEVLPGDTFQHSTSAVIRLSPLAAPIMHPVTVRIHHFFVPHRLSWDQGQAGGTFEDFITGGPDGNDPQTVPTATTTGVANDRFDYFGLPQVAGIEVNSMPLRAYGLIFNEWFRDQDLVPEQNLNSSFILTAAWEKDYLSTARPWPQKGDEVTLPLGGRAPVAADRAIGEELGIYANAEGAYHDLDTDLSTLKIGATTATEATSMYAYLAQATATTVNDVRRAFAIQRFQEARAQYGSRYTEYLRYLGIRSSDARLDRPEFLGGGSVQVSISEVLQTSPEQPGNEDRDEFGVGDLYGHGVAAVRSNKYRRFFEEHGYVISVLSVRPKVIYTNGIPRHWLRQFKEDFFQKELQQIGQQEVWRDEVFAEPGETGRDTWGYSDRYAEYKQQDSRVSNEFRGELDFWHLARIFESFPELNSTFINCVPSKRIFNVQNRDALWMNVRHSIVARRMVAVSSKSRIM